MTFTNSVSPTALNASLISLDLKESTVEVDSATGWATISIKLDDGSAASKSVEWTIIDSEILINSPASVESWLDSFGSYIKEFDLTIQDIHVSETEGTNVFSAEFEYDQEVLEGASTSWYASSSSCDGIFPEEQLCY